MNIFLYILLIGSIYCGDEKSKDETTNLPIDDVLSDPINEECKKGQDCDLTENSKDEYSDETDVMNKNSLVCVKLSSSQVIPSEYPSPIYSIGHYHMMTKKINDDPTPEDIDKHIKQSNMKVAECLMSKIPGSDATRHKLYLRIMERLFMSGSYIIHFYVFLYRYNPTKDVDAKYILDFVKALRGIETSEMHFDTDFEKVLVPHSDSEYYLAHKRALGFLTYLGRDNADLFERIVKTLNIHKGGHFYLSPDFLWLLEPKQSGCMVKNYCMMILPNPTCRKISEYTQEIMHVAKMANLKTDARLINDCHMKVKKIMYILSDILLAQIKYAGKFQDPAASNKVLLMRYRFMKEIFDEEITLFPQKEQSLYKLKEEIEMEKIPVKPIEDEHLKVKFS